MSWGYNQIFVRYLNIDPINIFMLVPEILGGFLKRVYTDFDMVKFDNRLKIQKYIYLMQRYGLNLGYSFSLYVRGPYCTELTKDAFQMKNYDAMQPIGFSNPVHEEKLKEFLKFFEPHKDNVVWLEIAASILIIHDLYSKEKEFVVDMVRNKSEDLKGRKEEIEKIWEEVISSGVFNG